MAIVSKIKKWGNSYGILITKEEMKKKNLHEKEIVVVDVKKRKKLEELFGICHFKKPIAEVMKDIKEGYND